MRSLLWPVGRVFTQRIGGQTIWALAGSHGGPGIRRREQAIRWRTEWVRVEIVRSVERRAPVHELPYDALNASRRAVENAELARADAVVEEERLVVDVGGNPAFETHLDDEAARPARTNAALQPESRGVVGGSRTTGVPVGLQPKLANGAGGDGVSRETRAGRDR